MKKLSTILIFIFSFVFLAHEVRADYATSYQSYIDTTGLYQTAHNSYLTARAAYLASKSLESEDKAKAATLKMLQARDGVVVSYLTAISSKLQSTKGLGDTAKNSLTDRINGDISWHNAHNSKLNSAGSLSDLVSDSDEAKNNFTNVTLPVVYSSIVNLGVANNTYLRDQLNAQISILEAKLNEIKINQDKDVSGIERSLVDVKNKISRSIDKDNAAIATVSSIKPNTFGGSNATFSDAQSNVVDANLYLKEATQSLLQIISQIKTAS